jgi:SAM-dependent methyltransferase
VSTPSDPIAVVGAGHATLVVELVPAGYRDVHAVDVSPTALDGLRELLADRAHAVTFHVADVRDVTFDEPLAVWHDRATLHFLTAPADRAAYVRRAADAVRPGGHLVLATFGPGGPPRCSGLPVSRHDAASLAALFAPAFDLVESFEAVHRTPWGADQQFLHALLRRC